MSDFKAKMAPSSISAGAPPQTPLAELMYATALPKTPLAVFKGPTSKEKEGKGGEKMGVRGGKEARGRNSLHTPCRKFLATPLSTSTRIRILAVAMTVDHTAYKVQYGNQYYYFLSCCLVFTGVRNMYKTAVLSVYW